MSYTERLNELEAKAKTQYCDKPGMNVIGYVNGNLNGLVFAIRVTRMSRVTYGACTVSNGVMLSAAANTPSGAVMLLGRYLRQLYQEVA